MKVDANNLIEGLEKERSDLWHQICNNEDLFHLESVYYVVMRVRVLTKLINNLGKQMKMEGK